MNQPGNHGGANAGPDDVGPEEARARFWKLLGRQRVAMLTTHAEGGLLRARPLMLAKAAATGRPPEDLGEHHSVGIR